MCSATATERDWLTRRISDIPLVGALQRIRDFPFCGEADKFALRSIAREALGEIGNERV